MATARVYAPGLTPAMALEINVRLRRERCQKDGRTFTEQPTRKSIAGRACPGAEIIDSGGTLTFRTRLFALTVAGQTVLVSTLSAVADDELTRTLLAPVAASLR